MTEPRARARRIEQVVPGVYRWHVPDERIGGAESDAYAVVDQGEVVLIDPLPLADDKPLKALGDIEAIVLTASCHQRSSWRYRRKFGCPVYAPEGAQGLEETPEFHYSGGEALPGGLISFHTPGPTEAMYSLLMTGPRNVVFLSDLLAHEEDEELEFVPAQYQDEPMRTRLSVRRILDQLPVDVVCPAHGPPILADGPAALRRALEKDQEFPNLPSY